MKIGSTDRKSNKYATLPVSNAQCIKHDVQNPFSYLGY